MSSTTWRADAESSRSRSRSTLTVSPSPDSSSNCVSPPSRSRASCSASAASSSAWRRRRSLLLEELLLSRSSVLGDRFGGAGRHLEARELADDGLLRRRFLTAAPAAGAALTAAFAGAAAGCFFVVAFFATGLLGRGLLRRRAFFAARLLRRSLLRRPSSGRRLRRCALRGRFATAFAVPSTPSVAAFFAAFFGEAAFVRADALACAVPRGALVVALAARRAPLLPCRGHRWSLRVRGPGTRPPGRAVQNTTRPRPLQRMAARRTWAASVPQTRATARSRRDARDASTQDDEMRSIRSPTCRSLPSIATRSRRARGRASCAAGPTTTCSPRACAGARVRPSGCSTKARRPRTAGPASTTCGPASFKDLYPRFHTMRGQLRRPQGRLGLPRPPGRARGREGARLHRQAADRGVRDRGVQRSAAASRCTATSRTGPALTSADRHVDRHRRRVLDADERRTSRASGGTSTTMWDKGSIYEGFKVVPYCGRCGTALSSHEVAQGVRGRHRAVGLRALPGRRSRLRPPRLDDHAVDAALQRRASPSAPTSSYVRVRGPTTRPATVVLAADRVEAVLGDDAEIVGPGRRRRARRAPLRAPVRRARRSTPTRTASVVAADFVTVDDGSGIVHLAPAFGEIDREVGEREGLPSQPGRRGRAVRRVGARVRGPVREGRRRRDHRRRSPRAGSLVRVVDYTHSYPHCWRCGTPLIYWAKPTWFARTSDHRDDAAPRERDDRLAPGAHQARPLRRLAREQRRLGALARPLLGHAAPDLALRRLRPRHVRRLGRRARGARRPRSRGARPAPARRRRRRDRRARSAAARAERVEPVLDAWFDSGSMPAAQFHYPFENADAVRAPLPRRLHLRGDRPDPRLVLLAARGQHARVRPRAVPQRRVPRATRRQGRPEDVEVARQRHRPVDDPRHPRRRRAALVLLLRGLAVDEPPRRRARGSTSRPAGSCSRSGTPTRSSSPTRTSTAGRPSAPTRAAPATHVLDRWIRSRLHSTVRDVTDALEGFDALASRAGARGASSTISRTGTCAAHGRGSGRRPTRRRTRRSTSASRTVALLLAPFCPFVADELYANLDARTRPSRCTSPTGPRPTPPRSTPRSRPRWRSPRQVVTLGRAARTEAKLKVRQPLPRALVLLPGGERARADARRRDRRRAQREARRAVADLDGLLDVHGRAELPRARARASAR